MPVVVGALALPPVIASGAIVQVSTSGNDSLCAPGKPAACRSIEKGVAVAAAGDVVQVGAGDFPVSAAGVHITKPLDLQGAKFLSDARTRDPNSLTGETVLHPAADETYYQGLLSVETGAGGTKIRGFRIE